MGKLRELYQEVIVDHGRNPRNFSVMTDASYCKEGFNPLCGDKITLYVHETNGIFDRVSFDGCGCAISMASASLMTETLHGKTLTEVNSIFELFHQLVTQGNVSENDYDKLGKLSVLGGVHEFPLRIKCATLAWHTLKALLMNDQQLVTTE